MGIVPKFTELVNGYLRRLTHRASTDIMGKEGGILTSIRVSIGTAGVLGLAQVPMVVAPTTAYLMLGERCVMNCYVFGKENKRR